MWRVHRHIMTRYSEYFKYALIEEVSHAAHLRLLRSRILIMLSRLKNGTLNYTVTLWHLQPALLRYLIECIYTRTYFGGPLLEPSSFSRAPLDNQFVVHIEMLRIGRLYKIKVIEDKAY